MKGKLLDRLLLVTGPVVLITVAVVLYRGTWRPFVWTSTRYGPGYSESAFRGITNGTPFEHLAVALGEPLSTASNSCGMFIFSYSTHGGGLAKWGKLQQVFVSNEVVVDKWREYVTK